jgi:Ca2+/Na+ antiporter
LILVILIVVTIILFFALFTKRGRKITAWTFIILFIIGLITSVTWPQSEREKLANSIAHNVCSNPSPSAQAECNDPWGFFPAIMNQYG